MFKVSFKTINRNHTFTQSASASLAPSGQTRFFAFFDLSKSRHKDDKELLKRVQLHQSPINIKHADSVYMPDVKI